MSEVRSVGVIGGGTVGKATARVWLEWVDEVRVFDVRPELATHPFADVVSSDLIFVCLPTGEVERFFNDHKGSERNFVLKSTVVVGTTRRLRDQYGIKNVVHSPEFLTARCSLTDAQLPARNIVGVPRKLSAWERTADAVEPGLIGEGLLVGLLLQRFPGTPLLRMTSDESEAVKLFVNGFFAVKISWWNECNSLCSKLGLTWSRILSGILSDGRISQSHTRVPGPDGKFGFGGSCLPKDLEMLAQAIERVGEVAAVSRALLKRNETDRRRTS